MRKKAITAPGSAFWASAVSALLFVLCFQAASAQYSDDVWIFFKRKHIEEPFRKWKPEIILDARQTFVGGEKFRIAGFRAGIEYRRVHRFGLGNYNLTKPVTTDQLDELGRNVESAKISLTYTTLFYERVFFFSRRWEFSTAAHAGIGQIRGSYTTTQGKIEQTFEPIEVVPVEVSTTLLFNPTWWLSVGGGVGQRLMTRASDDIQDTYNGGLYVAKLKIRFGKMFLWLFNKDVKNAY